MSKHAWIAVYFLLLFLPGFFSDLSAQNSWIPLAKPTTQKLNKLCFLDSLKGWVAGDGGTILKTTDGGLSWTHEDPRLQNNILSIYMLNEWVGWALARVVFEDTGSWYGTILLKTTDGGDSWEQNPFWGEFFNTIAFVDSLNGWMGSEYGSLYGSIDGGRSWTQAYVDSTTWYATLPVRRIKFFSPSCWYAVGGFREMIGVVWKTTDSGIHWSVRGVGDELFDIYFLDSLHIMAAGGGLDDGAGIARTTDGGTSWRFNYVRIFGQARALAFRTRAEGWVALGVTGNCMYTLDSGKTWKAVYTPDSSSVFDVAFTDPLTGYMVGASGTILKYNPAIIKQEIYKGWNLISLPVTTPDRRKIVLYPGSVSSAFSYSGSYSAADTLNYGEGYWLKFPASETLQVEGLNRSLDTVDVMARWNLIGTISTPTPVNKILEIPDSLIASSFFEYTGSYRVASALQPGKGYWVKVRNEGRLILHDERWSAPLRKAASGNPGYEEIESLQGVSFLAFADNSGSRGQLYFSSREEYRKMILGSELPPLPPHSNFDVRFQGGGSGGSFFEVLSAGSDSVVSKTISVQGAGSPLAVTYSIKENAGGKYSLREFSDGRLWKANDLRGCGTLSVERASASLELSYTPDKGEEIPSEFKLHRNYPNPFNPATTIRYELPTQCPVRLSVFNLLGQEVSRIVDEVQAPGLKTVIFRPGNIASGLYIYKLSAGSFSGVRSMILLR